MYFGLLKHLFQDFEGDTVELQNVIIAANCYINLYNCYIFTGILIILMQNVITCTQQLGLNLSVLGLAKVLWTFPRPFQDKLYERPKISGLRKDIMNQLNKSSQVEWRSCHRSAMKRKT